MEIERVRDVLTGVEQRRFDYHAEAVAIEASSIDRCERADVVLVTARSIRLHLEAMERVLEKAMAREHAGA